MSSVLGHFLPPFFGLSARQPWGDEERVLTLLSDCVASVGATRQLLAVDHFDTPREFVDFLRRTYGPAVAAYRNVAVRPDRVAELDYALVDLAPDHMTARGRMQWEYLILTAHRVR